MTLNLVNETAGTLKAGHEIIYGKYEHYYYFYPKKLPSNLKALQLDNETINKLGDTNLCLGELKGLTKNIKNIDLVASIYKTNEAVVSSRIEGTRVSLRDVFLSEAGPEKGRDSEINEVLNYVTSLDYGLSQLNKKKRITKTIVNRMHYFLLRNVRGGHTIIGAYRECQNWVGPKYGGIQAANFIPPKAQHIEKLMWHMFQFMNENKEVPSLLKIGLMHYYFETIHPYEDGNGRLGRTLILLYLNQLDLIKEPVLYLSPYFDRHKDQYCDLLMRVRTEGDYTTWLKFFLDGVTQISKETSEKVKKLIELHTGYKQRLVKVHATPITYLLLDHFFENPYTTIPRLQKKFRKNYPLIKRGIDKLKKCGIVTAVKYKKRKKIFIAKKVSDIISS